MEQGCGLRTGCSSAGRCTTACRPREVFGGVRVRVRVRVKVRVGGRETGGV
nr:hypothetical protein MDV080.5 [synthetic construct]ACF49661.1 hypothetical protein MDV000.5 [synthetic construct]